MSTIPHPSHSSLSKVHHLAIKSYSAHLSTEPKRNSSHHQVKSQSSSSANAIVKKEQEAKLKKDLQQLQKAIAEDAYLIDLGPLSKQVMHRVLSQNYSP